MDQSHLVTVFRKVSAFLVPSEMYILSRLNKYFHHHFINSEVQYHIGLKKLSQILLQDLTEENYQSVLRDITRINVSSLSEAIETCRYASNLLKNPSGAHGFNDWTVSNGGDGWAVESGGTFRNLPACFASSYAWGTLKQTIELPQLEGMKRKLLVGCPIKRRSDCGGTAKVAVKMLREDGCKISKKVEVECREQESEDPEQRFPWDLMSVFLEVDDSVRTAEIIFAGKDANFWAGHYGARLGYCFARILVYKESS